MIRVFLDITGAFDNIKWTKLLKDMEEVDASEATRTIIKSYLTDRWAELTVEKSTARARLTRGCPQGSILGSLLRNVMDRVLKIKKGDRIKMVAYADDLAV